MVDGNLLHLRMYMVVEFCLYLMDRFPTLNRWIQMQTNLHRVSESAMTTTGTAEIEIAKPEARAAVKRLRECDSDTESEIDDIFVTGHASSTSPKFCNERNKTREPSLDSPKSEKIQQDPTVLLSFDWENEGPYEKAVERYSFIIFPLCYVICDFAPL